MTHRTPFALLLAAVVLLLAPDGILGVGLPLGYLVWPALDRDPMRTGWSAIVGPDDPTVLGTPWPYTTRGPIASSAAIDAMGTAYIGADAWSVHAVAQNGAGHVLFKTGGPVRSSPALIANEQLGPPVLYVG